MIITLIYILNFYKPIHNKKADCINDTIGKYGVGEI